MGVKERREREQQELKQAIMEAAREIAAREDWQAVTIRKVAELIEYSPATIYEHYENKEAILLALAREGFRLLGIDLQAVKAQGGEPGEQIMEITRAYWHFAMRVPEMYKVMFGIGCPELGEDSGPPPEAQYVFQGVRQILEAFLKTVGITESDLGFDLDAGVEMIWGLTHGVITLTMLGRFDGKQERGLFVTERGIYELLRAWQNLGELKKQPATTPVYVEGLHMLNPLEGA